MGGGGDVTDNHQSNFFQKVSLSREAAHIVVRITRHRSDEGCLHNKSDVTDELVVV